MKEETRVKLEYKLNCLVALYAYKDLITKQQQGKKQTEYFPDLLDAVDTHRLTLYPIDLIKPEHEERIKAYLISHLRELDEAENSLKVNQPELYKYYRKIGLVAKTE